MLAKGFTDTEHVLFPSGIFLIIDNDIRFQKYKGIVAGFLYKSVSNLKSRFGYPFWCVVDLENSFIDRPQSPNFQNLFKLFKVDKNELSAESKILIRNSTDF